ncbi:MAG: tail fiber domain-containing protein [Okeania sp. SIO2G4]|nr:MULTISPECIES: tail fiber domain-containing protein [unclassified Okeania]NEP94493.1 tail fiber domain-containing protein [Okeania sp. SIO2F5]NEQ92110.1 tail fiber domain-containing protein [Okeania sp. SIO2G4]
MRLRHNRSLYKWGVVAGLEVTKDGDKKVAVSEGMAIDQDGREIILLPDSERNTLNLDGLELNTTIEIAIIYHEIKDKPYRIGDKTKYTRITERPKFIIYRGKKRENCDDDHLEVRTGSAPTDGNVMLLARVNLDNNGNVSTVEDSRKLAGGKTKWSDGENNSIYYNDGNVGIGTTSIHNPQSWDKALDILGSRHARFNVRSGGGVVTSVFSHNNWNGARGIIGTESNHPLTLATGYRHRMTIDTSGRVGIGTTNPSEKLEVNGTVKATKFEGDGSGLTGISGGGKWKTLEDNFIRYQGGVFVGNRLPSPKNNNYEATGLCGAIFAITERVNKVTKSYGVRGHFDGFLTVQGDDETNQEEIIVKEELDNTRDDALEDKISPPEGITLANSPESVKPGGFVEGLTENSVEAVDKIEGATTDQSILSGYGGYFTAVNRGTSFVYGVYGEAQNSNITVRGLRAYGVYGKATGAGDNYAGYFDGRVHVTGNLTANNVQQNSSRQLKENINTLTIEDALETLEGLNPVQFRYKEDHQQETHIGFIAEDVPDLVASRDHKTLSPMDIVAVLTKVVKEQNNTISLLMQKVQTLENKSQSSAF